MRVAHVTDIHWMVPPDLSDLNIKRVFGYTSLDPQQPQTDAGIRH